LDDLIKIGLVPTLMFLGIALRQARAGLRASHLEFLIIYFTFPVLMFTEILKANLETISIGGVAGISLVYLALCFLSSYGLSRKLNNREKGTVVFNSTFFNSMFLPFPLIYAFYGNLSIALLFSLPIAVVHNTLGIFMAAYWGHGKVGRKTLISAITFPPLIAFFLGALARPALAGFVGTSAFSWLSNIGVLTVYLSLIFVGLAIPLSRDSLVVFRNRISGLITLNRFFVSPLIALVLIALLNPAEAIRDTVLIMSLTPPAFTNLIIVSKFGLDVKATSQSLFLPTFASVGIIFALRFFALI
jgi:predicted permease